MHYLRGRNPRTQQSRTTAENVFRGVYRGEKQAGHESPPASEERAIMTEYRELSGDDIIRPGDQWYAIDDSRWYTVDVSSRRVGRVAGDDARWRRPWAATAEQPAASSGSKYHRVIRPSLSADGAAPITVDVYDVLRAFAVTCPATQHAIKKLLCPGMRGTKTARQDIQEAIVSLQRAMELIGGNDE